MKLKKFLIGIAIFIVSIIFIVFANKAVNTKPDYPNCSYPTESRYDNTYSNNSYSDSGLSDVYYKSCNDKYNQDLKNYKEKAFFIITFLSILAIIGGVLVRTVAPVSWGLVMSGLIMIMFIFIDNFAEVGKPYRAMIAGIALVVLIWLAYAKLGDKERISGQIPSTKTTPTPTPTPTVPPAPLVH